MYGSFVGDPTSLTRDNILFIGIGFTFSLKILFLFENGKPVAASSECDPHSQKEYIRFESVEKTKFSLSMEMTGN